jgi:hypothetical protein
VSAVLPGDGPGRPDWGQAIEAAQALPPALDTPAIRERAARKAEMVAKFTGHQPQQAPKLPQLRPRPEE